MKLHCYLRAFGRCPHNTILLFESHIYYNAKNLDIAFWYPQHPFDLPPENEDEEMYHRYCVNTILVHAGEYCFGEDHAAVGEARLAGQRMKRRRAQDNDNSRRPLESETRTGRYKRPMHCFSGRKVLSVTLPLFLHSCSVTSFNAAESLNLNSLYLGCYEYGPISQCFLGYLEKS